MTQVVIAADLTAAYEPEVGVEKFTRQFTFTEPGSFLVEDDIRTSKPRKIVSYLHSDTEIARQGDGFIFEPGTPNLFVQLVGPAAFETIVEKNILTAPGRPGSVDKGEREERGVKLAIASVTPVTNLRVTLQLTIDTLRSGQNGL